MTESKKSSRYNTFNSVSYRDNLRELKESIDAAEKLKDQDIPLYNTELYLQYLFDISDPNLDVIDTNHFYKKSMIAKHTYTFPIPSIEYIPRKTNLYKDLELFLPKILDPSEPPAVNVDFLTGYYLAVAFIIPSIINKQSSYDSLIRSVKSFHPGLSKDGIVRGLWYGFKQSNQKIKWEFYGCDKHTKKEYTKLYLNGLTKDCNIFNINTIRSITIQLEAKLGKKYFDFSISDVRPETIFDVYTQLLLCYNTTKDIGLNIIRMPLDWRNQYTAFINLLIYCISSYDIVKIFKTPWGDTPKLYLLLSKPKHKSLTAARYASLLKFVENGAKDKVNLYNKMIFNIDEDVLDLKPESYMDNLIYYLGKTYTDLLSFDENLSTTEANELWLTSMRL